MRRRLIIGERIMYVDASTPLNCVFAVKLKGIITLSRLQKALFKIQQKHPLLQSSIEENNEGVPYFVSNDEIEEIPVRIVSRSGNEDWQVQSRKEWGKLFNDKNMPLARVVWIQGEEVSEILLVCPHCVCDGSTFVTLMNELLLLLDRPDTVLNRYLTFNSIEGLLGNPPGQSIMKLLRAKFFSALANVFFLLKTPRKPEPVGDNYFLHWKLDVETSQQLVQQCKQEKVTVHAALCLGFLRAFQKVRGKNAHGKVICPVDIRRFIPEIKADMMFSFAPIAELKLEKSKSLDLWMGAKKLKEELNTKIAAMDVRDLLLMSEYFHSSAKKMVKFLLNTDGTHDLTLSNMGKLAIGEHYESFEIEAMYSPTVGFPWRNPNTLVVSSFKGVLDFTFLSNDSFLSREDAVSIRDAAMNFLLTDSKKEQYA